MSNKYCKVGGCFCEHYEEDICMASSGGMPLNAHKPEICPYPNQKAELKTNIMEAYDFIRDGYAALYRGAKENPAHLQIFGFNEFKKCLKKAGIEEELTDAPAN